MTPENRIPDLLNELEYLATHFVEVGIFSGSDREDDTPMLMIAFVHEFGMQIPKQFKTTHVQGPWGSTKERDEPENWFYIPERSYLRAGFDANLDKIQREFELLLSQVLELKITGKSALDLIGASVTTKIQDFLVELKEPPLAESTIRAKGSSNPLIDTGQLMNSITWKITEVSE